MYRGITDPRIVALERRTLELDTFLTEYRDLQSQLVKMRRACDNFKEDNLKKEMDELKSSLFISSSMQTKDNGIPNIRWTQLPNQETPNDVVVKPILKKPNGVSTETEY